MSSQKKSVLGRGLNALIPKAPLKEVSIRGGEVGKDSGGTGIIARIDLDSVRPNPYQPRAEFDQASLDELSRSILEKGVIQPITVRRFNGEYQLISGERRLRAAQKAGLAAIPAYIIEVSSDEELLELALVENIQREELNPIDIASAYQRLLTECRLTQEQVAQKVGKDRSTVTNFLRLLKLPTKIKDGLRKGVLSMGHARAIINVPSERDQLKLYEKIVRSGFSVRAVEQIARARKKGPTQPRRSVSADVRHVETKLREYLGTKVTLRTKGGGKGEIVIEYYSLDDLDRLLDLLGGK